MQSGNWKLLFTILGIVVVSVVAIQLLQAVLHYALPIIIIGTLGYIAYSVTSKKGLPGNRRWPLP